MPQNRHRQNATECALCNVDNKGVTTDEDKGEKWHNKNTSKVQPGSKKGCSNDTWTQLGYGPVHELGYGWGMDQNARQGMG